jgi:hypothetical protein
MKKSASTCGNAFQLSTGKLAGWMNLCVLPHSIRWKMSRHSAIPLRGSYKWHANCLDIFSSRHSHTDLRGTWQEKSWDDLHIPEDLRTFFRFAKHHFLVFWNAKYRHLTRRWDLSNANCCSNSDVCSYFWKEKLPETTFI